MRIMLHAFLSFTASRVLASASVGQDYPAVIDSKEANLAFLLSSYEEKQGVVKEDLHTDSTTWKQLGSSLHGNTNTYFSVPDISGDGNTITMSAFNNDNGLDYGSVTVYRFNTSSHDWSPLGNNIIIDSLPHEKFSDHYTVKLSYDGNTICIGSSRQRKVEV